MKSLLVVCALVMLAPFAHANLSDSSARQSSVGATEFHPGPGRRQPRPPPPRRYPQPPRRYPQPPRRSEERCYLNRYPDICINSPRNYCLDPAKHYREHGRFEGRIWGCR